MDKREISKSVLVKLEVYLWRLCFGIVHALVPHLIFYAQPKTVSADIFEWYRYMGNIRFFLIGGRARHRKLVGEAENFFLFKFSGSYFVFRRVGFQDRIYFLNPFFPKNKIISFLSKQVSFGNFSERRKNYYNGAIATFDAVAKLYAQVLKESRFAYPALRPSAAVSAIVHYTATFLRLNAVHQGSSEEEAEQRSILYDDKMLSRSELYEIVQDRVKDCGFSPLPDSILGTIFNMYCHCLGCKKTGKKYSVCVQGDGDELVNLLQDIFGIEFDTIKLYFKNKNFYPVLLRFFSINSKCFSFLRIPLDVGLSDSEQEQKIRYVLKQDFAGLSIILGDDLQKYSHLVNCLITVDLKKV